MLVRGIKKNSVILSGDNDKQNLSCNYIWNNFEKRKMRLLNIVSEIEFKGWPPLWYKIDGFWQFFGKVTALKLTILSCRGFPCANTFIRRYHRSLPSNMWKDVSILLLASKRHTLKKWQKSNLSTFKSVPIVMNTLYGHKIN